MNDTVEIWPVKSPIDESRNGPNAKQYYAVYLTGSNKWLHPHPNEFLEGNMYLFNSENEAEEAIAAYFGNGLWGAL